MKNPDTLATPETARTAAERGATIREEAVAHGTRLREAAVARARALGAAAMV